MPENRTYRIILLVVTGVLCVAVVAMLVALTVTGKVGGPFNLGGSSQFQKK